MSDQLEVLKVVVARLDELRVPYMVTGSLAASRYAIPRFTRDIDLVVEIHAERVERLADVFAVDFYVDVEALRAAVTRAGMVNLIHLGLLVKVDLIIRKDTAYRREEFARRRRVTVDGANIWFVTPEDLVLSKLLWAKDSGSEVQRRDVQTIVSSVADLDRPYIERWARELTVIAAWHEVVDAES